MKQLPNGFKWAANQRMESFHDADSVAFYVRGNGGEHLVGGEIVMASISEAVYDYAACDGLKKRVNDACAGCKTVTERVETIKRFCDHYNGGSESWNLERVATVSKLDRAAMFSAIALWSNVPAADVAMRLQSKSDAELRSYNSVREVAVEYTRLTRQDADESTAAALLKMVQS